MTSRNTSLQTFRSKWLASLAAVGCGLSLLRAAPLESLQPVSGAGLSQVFRGTWGTGPWFFKRPKPKSKIYATPNFEAEFLVRALREPLGLPGPRLALTSLPGHEGLFLASESVASPKALPGKALLEDPGAFDPKTTWICAAELRRHFFLDLLTGNADRHLGNFFLTRSPEGYLHLTPIDEDLAFATPRVVRHYYFLNFTPSYFGMRPVPQVGRDFVNPRYARRCGRVLPFVLANPLYRALWRDLEAHPTQEEVARAKAKELGQVLSDQRLQAALESVPAAAWQVPDPGPRRREIGRIFRRRRELLPSIFEVQGRRRDPVARRALAWFDAGVGQSLGARLSLPPRQRSFLGLRLALARIDRFGAEELYGQLRDLGVAPDLAHEALARLFPKDKAASKGADPLEAAYQKATEVPVSLRFDCPLHGDD